MKHKKILLSGFIPFGNDKINPSWEAVRKLQGRNIKDCRIIGLRLPVVFGRAGEIIISGIKKHRPDGVISLGLHANTPVLLLERVGLNIHCGQDEKKKKPHNELIIAGGPAAYFATLPHRPIIARARKAGIPINTSFHAGTYLCNEVLYTVLHYIAINKLAVKAGFIHIPMLTEQAAGKPQPGPSMSLETIVKGVRLICEEMLG